METLNLRNSHNYCLSLSGFRNKQQKLDERATNQKN